MIRARTLIAFGCLAVSFSFAQGTFQNLNFESGSVVPVPGAPFGAIEFAPAFPGWTGTIDGQNQTNTLYNNLLLSLPYFALIDSSSTVGKPIQGNFTALFGASMPFISAEASLFQTGLVPADSLSVRFAAFPPDNGFTVSLNGTPLNAIPLGSPATNFPYQILYAADVSSFAGQVAELRFTVQKNPLLGHPSDLWLDSISFSPNPVPEPSTFAMLGLGAVLFYFFLRGKRLS